MFCVIQEVDTKKTDKNGYPKDLKSDYITSSMLGTYAYHYYGEERFERPVKKAYRVSIHESYRENGKVRKRQFAICTVNYYDLATDIFSLYDWGGSKIKAAATDLQVDEGTIYDLIEKKLQIVWDRITAEFHQTEEYQVHQEHERITTVYAAKKVKFNEQYGACGNEYNQCYDVYGKLWNPERLEQIKAEHKTRKEYERYSRSYYKNYQRNYGSTESSYGDLGFSNHSADDKSLLKKFYRLLSKEFHPDNNPDKDTSEEMRLLNRLKNEWGV